MYIIEASNVSKSYGFKKVLDNIDIKVKDSSVFALLGPNGAGKTTFVKSILGLVRLSSGTVKLNNLSSKNERSRAGVAFLPETFNFFPYYTVEGVVTFYGKMAGFKGQNLKQRVDDSLDRIKMFDNRKLKIKTLSKGMLQRTGIASMLVGDNNLFILDEPFSGLDPLGIKTLKDIVQSLKKEGKSIFINSHILSEMEKVCDEMAILNKGCILAQGNISELIGDQSLEDYFYEKVEKI